MNVENYVVKHNKLIELKGRMTTLEQKLLSVVIAMLNPDDKDFKEYKVDVNEFTKYISSKHKDLYAQLKDTATSLRDRKIEIEKVTDKGKSFIITGWISSAQYIDGEGYLTVHIDPLIKPYLLELKEMYTQYQLKNILKLKGTHSIRIYELLKQYEKIGKRQLDLVEFKKMLGIEKEYKRIYDLERYVLDPAKEEIDRNTDLLVDYEKIRKGRKVVAINFIISTKPCGDEKYIKFLKEHYDIDEIKKKCGLEKEIFNVKQTIELYAIAVKKTESVEVDPYEYIRINYMKMINNGSSRNKFAYFKKALEYDYAKATLQIKSNYKIDPEVNVL